MKEPPLEPPEDDINIRDMPLAEDCHQCSSRQDSIGCWDCDALMERVRKWRDSND